jgi:hypothetical protein
MNFIKNLKNSINNSKLRYLMLLWYVIYETLDIRSLYEGSELQVRIIYRASSETHGELNVLWC